MHLLRDLEKIWDGTSSPFLISGYREISFSNILDSDEIDLSSIRAGDVVALIGDFNPETISALLRLIDMAVILVPLTIATQADHEYFFEQALVDVVIEDGCIRRINHCQKHSLIEELRLSGHAGLVLFSTGTTGRPKAILHDFDKFLKRYRTPRPALRTLNFLLFDHIGGINTLFHTLFNRGVVIAPSTRSVESVLECCAKYEVEVLPTTPTFLRMMLISGLLRDWASDALRIITYGTERMDQPTLDDLCDALPKIEFRQTYGMSELGILRVSSVGNRSLYMRIGGEGIETSVREGVLHIRSTTRMLGYLNAPSPFDEQNWYKTGDLVDQVGDTYRIVGRVNDVINVGGLKFVASEVEKVALDYPGVALAKVIGKSNPITGQHAELTVQPIFGSSIDKENLLIYLKANLQGHMVPRRILIDLVPVGHRFKRG